MAALPSGTVTFLFTDIEGKYLALGADNGVNRAFADPEQMVETPN
jgi:hypothetical protein